ncbi:head-tail connector protein [Falsihalocynthiibacter sp. S25ZX9]|uniref:head-tail connector protein n=1 Tax=Falsihalocynthiibacter sp. S25ZX9 TaxID=3240870 RepID=UPI00350EB500
MSAVSLADAKKEVGVRHDEHDTLLTGYLEAATVHAQNHVNRIFADDYGADLPSPIRIAILMHVAFLYRNRGAASDGKNSELPNGYKMLLEAYRNFLGA